jgi:hypothetical protein
MKKLPIKVGDFFVDHFFGGGSHPYFGVWETREGFQLVCVCVYRKGAEEVLRRLTKPQISKEGGEKALS